MIINSQSELRKNYSQKGFFTIRNFFIRKKIIKLKKDILKQIEKKKYYFYYEKIKNKKKIRRIEKVSDEIVSSKKIILSKKIFNLLKILNKQNNILFKDKLNFKYPGGAGFLPHIDGHFMWLDENNRYQKGWKKYSGDFINIVIPLEKSSKENGCIYVSDKNNTNRLGKTFDQITKKMIINTPNIKPQNLKKFNFVPIELNIGDIFVFNWKCAHFSKKNISKKSRMIFYLTFCRKNIKIKNLRKVYYYDKKNSKNDEKNKSLQTPNK